MTGDEMRALLERAEDALHSIALDLLAVSPHLKVPYTDRPEASPWSMFTGPQARRAHDLAMEIRKYLGLPHRWRTRAAGTPPLEERDVAIAAAAAALHEITLRVPCPEDAEIAAAVLEAAAPHLGLTAQASIDALASVLPEAATERIQELEQLAAEILATYVKTGDGYRGRVGQVQIQRWQQQLGGE